jgi:3-isopropylmalate/(R)-2-methylmalate dehydratase small subunit
VKPRFETVTSRYARIPSRDIDTDQIIPARYLRTTVRTGLGAHLFADRRHFLDGAEGAAVLVAGDNFGCGSSREHAPWALTDFGFRVVISTSFADIFRGNSLKNGLLPLVVDAEVHTHLFGAPAGATVTIDLPARRLDLPWGESVTFAIDPFSARCLVAGQDELDYLLSFQEEIARHESRRA